MRVLLLLKIVCGLKFKVVIVLDLLLFFYLGWLDFIFVVKYLYICFGKSVCKFW